MNYAMYYRGPGGKWHIKTSEVEVYPVVNVMKCGEEWSSRSLGEPQLVANHIEDTLEGQCEGCFGELVMRDVPYTASEIGEYVRADVERVRAVCDRLGWLVEATDRPVTLSRSENGRWLVNCGVVMAESMDGLAEALRLAVLGVYGKQTMPPLPKGCEVQS